MELERRFEARLYIKELELQMTGNAKVGKHRQYYVDKPAL